MQRETSRVDLDARVACDSVEMTVVAIYASTVHAFVQDQTPNTVHHASRSAIHPSSPSSPLILVT